MLYQRRTTEIVNAIEWTGENLREVQELMYPDSPLDHGDKRESLGVNVYDPSQQYGRKVKLAFVPKGGIIAKDAQGHLEIWQSRALFEEHYELIGEANPVPEPAPPAAPINDEPLL